MPRNLYPGIISIRVRLRRRKDDRSPPTIEHYSGFDIGSISVLQEVQSTTKAILQKGPRPTSGSARDSSVSQQAVQSPFSCHRGNCNFEVLSYVGCQRGFAKCLYDQCNYVQSRPLGNNVQSVRLDTMYYSLITTPIFSDSRLRISSRAACFRHKDLCRTFAIANRRS